MSRLSAVIADAQDIRSEDIPVPEWNVTLRIKGMDGTRRGYMLDNHTDETGVINYTTLIPAMIIACTFDPEDDSPVFQAGDEPMILSKASFVIERVGNAALRLSGLDKQAEERLGKADTSVPSQEPSGTLNTSTPNTDSTTN